MTISKERKNGVCVVCGKKFKLVATVSILCSCKCAVTYYTALKQKSRKAASAVAKMVGRRSMAEVRFDAKWLEGKRIKAEYEADTFLYKIEEVRKYTPDWTIHTRSHNVVYVEFKGVLDKATRKKMKLVKAAHPELDIRIVFEKASNKIYKGSNTTYGMWAMQHGFKWSDNTLPKDWNN